MKNFLRKNQIVEKKKSPELTPARAIRKFCLECMGGNAAYVRDCPTAHCQWYPLRLGKGRVKIRQIREWCLHCHGWLFKDGKLDPDYKDGGQAWARNKVRYCKDKECPFYTYRMGTNPSRQRLVNKGHFVPGPRADLSPKTPLKQVGDTSGKGLPENGLESGKTRVNKLAMQGDRSLMITGGTS